MHKRDLFELWTNEAKSYSSLTEIEHLIEDEKSLSGIPVLPLYVVMKSLPDVQLSELLPRLDPSQRAALCDLDIWKRDELNPQTFGTWLAAYAHCSDDETVSEFVKSETFATLLKARFNIYTFDVEEPEYPDHDRYFLTEDNLLLFEYDESFGEVNELKILLRRLYGELGVEHAYTQLFKMVSDSPTVLLEEEYRFKKGRLADIGMVDYFDARELLTSLRTIEQIDLLIKKRTIIKAHLDDFSKNQGLHSSVLNFYEDKDKRLSDLLSMIDDEERKSFLRFNFIRLNNAHFVLNDDLERGSVAIGRAVSLIKTYLSLGLDYLDSSSARIRGVAIPDSDLFMLFDFVDLYRIGKSLISIAQVQTKMILAKNHFELDEDSFLGRFYNELVDNLLSDLPKVALSYTEKPTPINSVLKLEYLKKYISLLSQLAPLAHEFKKQIDELSSSGKIDDDYYQNYPIKEIDFETLLLTFLANFTNGMMAADGRKKLGLMLNEYLSFAEKMMDGDTVLEEKAKPIIKKFIAEFSPQVNALFEEYFLVILKEALEGYEFKTMVPDDWKHVGGPILLRL